MLQFFLVIIEGKLGAEVWTHQDRINNGVFAPNKPNTSKLFV